jgi:hypothetical protein
MGNMFERKGKTLTLVRDLGYDQELRPGSSTCEVFFIGPVMHDREYGDHATEEAIHNYIQYREHEISVAKAYLANGRNNKMHEWKAP